MPQTRLNAWLANFTGIVTEVETERLHALFWLSQFMYYGSAEIRVLLRSLYRDLFFCPMVQEVRRCLPQGAGHRDLRLAVIKELDATLFFGVGNPSESGIHLLYFFRQENELSRRHFLDVGQIFKQVNNTTQVLNKPHTRRYVFLDDVCGSGDTAAYYSSNTVSQIANLDESAKFAYYTLFASSEGLLRVRSTTKFSAAAGAVHEFDPSYRALSQNARFFTSEYPDIDPVLAREIVTRYGALLDPDYANGYKDAQLLLGFHHNTPDNTLGIFWQDHVKHGAGLPWVPAFRRYPKVYGDMNH